MVDEFRKIDEQNTQRRANLLQIAYIDTSQINDKQLHPNYFSIEEMYNFKMIPIEATTGSLLIGITTNTSQNTLSEIIKRFPDQRVSFAIISDSGFKEYMTLYNPPKKIEYQDIVFENTNDSEMLVAKISEMLEKVGSDDMLAYLVQQAFRLNSSDIHLENERDWCRVRFRIDGVLHPVARLSNDKYRLLISSLASLANLSTSINDYQTGHIHKDYQMLTGETVAINLRVETVNTTYGMDAVLRLFNFKPDYLNLDNLGLESTDRSVFDQIIAKPSGLVLLVGPTGSGKTTTLYSIINALNNTERKIITLEDPIEYNLPGVVQIPINSRAKPSAFSDGLKSVLRLDPDTIMVGEIRDVDTAKTALQAALTGHLVLSTYHASSASGALTRLLDATDGNPLFISSIRLISAQRLIRKLDDSSKEPYQPNEAIKSFIQSIIDTFPENVAKPDISNLTLYKAVASNTSPYGYNGQIALRELLTISEEFSMELHRRTTEITTTEIESFAVKNGMKTILHKGIEKVIAGETTIEELYRVVV